MKKIAVLMLVLTIGISFSVVIGATRSKKKSAARKAKVKPARGPFDAIGDSRSNAPVNSRLKNSLSALKLRGIIISGKKALALLDVGDGSIIMVRSGQKFRTISKQKNQPGTVYSLESVKPGKVILKKDGQEQRYILRVKG